MRTYRTQHGDSPAIIARKHGVSMNALLGANPHKPVTIVSGQRTWSSLGLGEPLHVPGSLGDVASDTAAALAAVDPCDQTYVGMVCSFQTLVGLTPDGKYGSGTAAKGAALGVKMPPGCSPRPSWWAPTGKSNCGQLAATPSSPGSALGNAASAAYAALSADSNYCLSVGKSGTAVNAAIHNFKTAWNAAHPSSPVPVGTGKYEPVVAAALSTALSGQSVPPGCGSPGSPNQPPTPSPSPSPAPLPPPPAPAPAPYVPPPAPAPYVPPPAAAVVQAPAAVQALLSVNPCDPSSAATVCAAQRALGIGADGKYGSDTSTAARRLLPSAPPGCTPRPAWWTPAGQSNCPGAAPPPPPPMPIPAPAPAPSGGGGVIPGGGSVGPAVIVPTTGGVSTGGISTGAIVAGAVGAVALVGIIAAASMAGKGKAAAGRRGARGKRGPARKGKSRKKPTHKRKR